MSEEVALIHARMVDLLHSMGESGGNVALWADALERLTRQVTDEEFQDLYVALWQFRQLLTMTLRQLSAARPDFKAAADLEIKELSEGGQ